MTKKGLVLNLTQDNRWYPAYEVKILEVAENWIKTKKYFWSFPRWIPSEGNNMMVIEVLKSNRETVINNFTPNVNPEAKIGFNTE